MILNNGNSNTLIILESNKKKGSFSEYFMSQGFENTIKTYTNSEALLKYLESVTNDYGWNVNLPYLILVDIDSLAKPVLSMIKRIKHDDKMRYIPLITIKKKYKKELLQELYAIGVNTCFEISEEEAEKHEIYQLIKEYWMKIVLY